MSGEPSKSNERLEARNRARSIARLAAVQALFQIDVSETAPDDVLTEFRAHRLKEGEGREGESFGPADLGLFDTVMDAALDHLLDVNEVLIATLPKEWSLPRIDSNLRAILRAGAGELIGCPQTPARVILKEYTDIADAFFGKAETDFAAGVLNAVARKVRGDELK